MDSHRFGALAAFVVCALATGGSTAGGDLAVRALHADACLDPTPKLGATLEAVWITGASVMHAVAPVASLDGHDVACDVVEFKLKNRGKQSLVFHVLGERPTVPYVTVEAFAEEKWTSSIPILGADGKPATYTPPFRRYASLPVVVEPGKEYVFPVHVERWRLQVAKKLRIRLFVSQSTKPAEDAGEVVYSNAFTIADA